MACRCESIRPGTTARPFASMTIVRSPRCLRTSSSAPTATNLPSLIATADAAGWARSWVATRPLTRIRSAGCCAGAAAPVIARNNRAMTAARRTKVTAEDIGFLLRGERSLLELAGGILGLLVTLRHGAVVGHQLVVECAPLGRVVSRPRALELAQHGVGGHRDDAGLGHPGERGLRRHLAHVARRIQDVVDGVPLRLRLQRGEG